MSILSFLKRGKKTYLACVDCGAPKKTRKAQSRPRCRQCASVSSLPIIDGKKKCRKCGAWKSKEEFSRDSRREEGLGPRCLDCERERQRNYRVNHREEKREFNKRYLEKDLQRLRVWSENNPEKRREVVRKNNAKYRRDHPDRRLINQNNRRARVIGNGGIITAQEWEDLKKKYDYTCLCCRKSEPEIKLTLDHVVPVSLGGKNVIGNSQPLCASCNSRKRNKVIDYR